VTAGASAPESLVQALIDRLRSLGASRVRVLEGAEEHVVFPLPRGSAEPRLPSRLAARSRHPKETPMKRTLAALLLAALTTLHRRSKSKA